MPEAVEFTVWEINLADRCPFIPEGATEYEAQEINRLWRNAINGYQDSIIRANARLSILATGLRHNGERGWIETRPAANCIQKHAIAIAAEQALGEFINAVEHRLALAKREES